MKKKTAKAKAKGMDKEAAENDLLDEAIKIESVLEAWSIPLRIGVAMQKMNLLLLSLDQIGDDYRNEGARFASCCK